MQLLSDGVSTKDIANQFSVNEQRIFALNDRFKTQGLLGLLEEPRLGRPSKISERGGKILLNLLDQSKSTPGLLAKVTDELGVSADAIWRRARLLRTNLTRSIARDTPVTSAPIETTGLLGLLISRCVNISVSLTAQSPNGVNSSSGILDTALLSAADIPSSMNLIHALDFIATAKCRKNNESFRNDRQLKELYLRWLKMVRMSDVAQNHTHSVQVAGDFASDNMLYCLQCLKHAIHKVGFGRSTVTFIPNFKTWLTNLTQRDLDATPRKLFERQVKEIHKRPELVFAWSSKFNN